MQYSDGSRVLIEHIRKATVGHRAFVQISAHEHNTSGAKPIVHFGALNASLGLHASEQATGAMDGRIEQCRTLFGFYTFEDHGVVAHASANEASLTWKGWRRALPYDPKMFAAMLLTPCEVMVVMDTFHHLSANDLANPFHHPLETAQLHAGQVRAPEVAFSIKNCRRNVHPVLPASELQIFCRG
jgi:hypothetical protein